MTPFWEQKTLEQMSLKEWELLCDGCGKCCLHKLIDSAEDDCSESGALYYTDVRCRYLDADSARCSCYPQRLERVAECVNITVEDLPHIHFMPPSCAYRRLHEGKTLPAWHPLHHNGSVEPMKQARVSIHSFTTVAESEIAEDDYEDRIVTWPLNG